MTIIKRIDYSSNEKISALKVDSDTEFVWVAYEQDSDGICVLKKQFAFNPSQTFFTVNVTTDQINDLDVSSSYIFAAYTDDNLIGQRFGLNNPLTSITDIDKPVGINEEAVAVGVSGSDVWFLTPGDASAENAKLLKYDTSGNLDQIVDLSSSGRIVYNARSFAFDSNGDMWVITFTDPAEYIRVFDVGGGVYNFEIFETL